MVSVGISERVARVQAELGVRVPTDYADFLDRHGHVETAGLTIYGYSQDMVDAGALPSIIGAT